MMKILKAAWVIFMFDIYGRVVLLAGASEVSPKYWGFSVEARFRQCLTRIQSNIGPRVTWLG